MMLRAVPLTTIERELGLTFHLIRPGIKPVQVTALCVQCGSKLSRLQARQRRCVVCISRRGYRPPGDVDD